MIITSEHTGLGRQSKIAEHDTFAEAFAAVEAMNPICLEADPDYPDCADAYMADGRLITIQPHDFRAR